MALTEWISVEFYLLQEPAFPTNVWVPDASLGCMQMWSEMDLCPVMLRGEPGDRRLMRGRIFGSPLTRGPPRAIELFPQRVGRLLRLGPQRLQAEHVTVLDMNAAHSVR